MGVVDEISGSSNEASPTTEAPECIDGRRLRCCREPSLGLKIKRKCGGVY